MHSLRQFFVIKEQIHQITGAKMIFRHFGLILLFVTSGLHGLHVTPYGLYEDIVVEISEQVPRQKCQRALDNLEVSFFHPFN